MIAVAKSRNWIHVALIMAGLTVFMVLGVSSYTQKNNTFDEEYHLLRGAALWRTGDFLYSHGHPPLINALSALPIAFNPDYITPPNILELQPQSQVVSYLLLWKNRMDAEKILNSCRFVIMLLGAALLVVIYAWARELHGPPAGLIVFAAAILSPNLMAHSRFITTDLGVTLFYFLAAYLLWRWMQRKESRGRLVWAGVALGLAQLSKFSAVILYPTFFIVILTDMFISNPSRSVADRLKRACARGSGYFVMMVLLSLVIVFMGYAFSPKYTARHFSNFIAKTGWHQALEETKRETAAKQAAAPGQAVAPKHVTYLFGENKPGRIGYAPVIAFFVKTPIPMLALLLAALLTLRRSRGGFAYFAAVFGIPILYFCVALMAKKNYQLRYFLPVYPFIFIAIAGLWARIDKGYLKKGLFGVFLLWMLAENALVYPHYLTYFNEFAGGPKNGHKVLLDSNFDWGQDMKGLAKYTKEKGIGSIALSYFGRGDPLYYGLNFKVLPSGRFTSLNAYMKDRQSPFPPEGWVAVSANLLMGRYMPHEQREVYAPLREFEPVDRIGNTIFIYRLHKKGR